MNFFEKEINIIIPFYRFFFRFEEVEDKHCRFVFLSQKGCEDTRKK
jgi:hypothetical protein